MTSQSLDSAGTAQRRRSTRTPRDGHSARARYSPQDHQESGRVRLSAVLMFSIKRKEGLGPVALRPPISLQPFARV